MKKTLLLMLAFAFVGTAAMAQLEQKDYKKEVIDQIKNDYPKSKDEEGAADVDNKSQIH